MLDCIFIGELWSCIKVKCKHAKDKEGGSLESPFSTYSRVWIIFSEVIFENLVSSSNSQGVWGSEFSVKMLYKVYNLTLFEVRYKQIV